MTDSSLSLLTEQGSLTELMTQMIGHSPLLQCLSQGRQTVLPAERQVLSIKPRQLAHVREITLGTEDNQWLFARTVIPRDTLRGDAKRLSRINNTPLGKVLFGRLRARRLNLRVDLVFADEIELQDFNIPNTFPLWQRRSVFQLSSGPLLITEIFLPDCPVYEYSKE